MTSISTVAVGLSAALRLARGRSDGVDLVADDSATAAASFWAVIFCIPSVVCRVLMSWVGTGIPAAGGHEIARELIIFILGWLIFVEASYWIARATGVSRRWHRFISVWNWCNVIEGVLVIAGGVPGLIGVPDMLDEACQVITLGWALWLEWYATRLALGVDGFSAFGLVLLDQAIGIVLGSIAISINP